MVPGLPCHRSTRWTASGSDCRTVDVQTSLDEVGQPVQACLHLIQLSSEYRQQVHGDCDWETNVADQLDKLVHVVPPWQWVPCSPVMERHAGRTHLWRLSDGRNGVRRASGRGKEGRTGRR